MRSAKTAATRSPRVGKRRYRVAFPVPALFAISSSGASRPCSANTARAASTMASLLRAASALSVMIAPSYNKWGTFPTTAVGWCAMTQPTHPAQPPTDPEPSRTHVDALRSSVERLRDLATPMTGEELTAGAYPTEWTVAQVLSHLGSGAVIMQRRLEDGLAGQDTPDDFAPGVWDTWNAKSPVAQRDDALAADAALLARIEAVPPDDRNTFTSAMGPMTLGFAQFVGMRLNEHAFHTWDIEVVANPAATIPVPVAALVVDNLDLVARFTGRPTGDITTITVATTDPERGFTVELTPDGVALTPDGVALTPDAGATSPDVELPAEAFARLVYGRLDAEHTPAGEHGSALDILRRLFPGP